MPREMRDLWMREVSGVNRAANLSEGWLMMKSATPETAAILSQAYSLAKGFDPFPTGRTPEMPDTIDREELAKAFPGAVSYIEGLEKALVLSGKATPATTPAPTEAEVLAKELASLPEPVRKVMIESQRRAAEAEEITKGLLTDKERGEYVAKAATLTALPGVKPAEFAEVMRKAAHGDADSLSEVFKALTNANEAIRTSNLFKEIGSNAPAAGSAEEEIVGFAKGLMDKNPSLTHADAMAQAAGANPDVYARYSAEMNRRNRGLEG